MPDTRPFLIPVHVVVAGVAYAGTYQLVEGVLTVGYEGQTMAVELGVGLPGTRAQQVLAALVKRARRRG